jgi:hypothetical protein
MLEMPLKYLALTGHRRIAVEDGLMRQSFPQVERDAAATELVSRLSPDLQEVRSFSARETGRHSLGKLLKETYPEALLVSEESLRLVQSALEENQLRPGENISLISSGSKGLRKGISIVQQEPQDLVRHSYRLLAGHLYNSSNPLSASRLEMAFLAPALYITDSVRKDLVQQENLPSGSKITFEEIQRARTGLTSPWPFKRDERMAQARQIQQATYSKIPSQQERYQPLDLGNAVNEPYSRPVRGFGHPPLRYLPTGSVWWHGVPFKVLDDNHGSLPACLVMRSSRRRRSAGTDLPWKVTLPVNQNVEALFFLHGCAHALQHKRFASYTMQFEDGQTREVPLVSRGRVPDLVNYDLPGIMAPLTSAAKKQGVNIQDWYHEYPQFQEPHAKAILFTDPEGDPYHHQSYLYTLRWQNPRAEVPLKSIVVESDPTCLTTLGLFGVTLLMASFRESPPITNIN